jgi:hypothetical protein
MKGWDCLVVIDPEDREQVERLVRAMPAEWNLDQPDDPELFEDSTTGVQQALRSLIAPPRPEEPMGLGAVVEDAEGNRFVRSEATGSYPWSQVGDDDWWTYPNIKAVRVLSEGWRADD